MPPVLFIPGVEEARQVLRFVALIQGLTADALATIGPTEVPSRDRAYVARLSLLAEEDPDIIKRQRVVWLKLQQDIRLLEAEARELLEVLGCRGFYVCSLDLRGMVLGRLDLRGAVIAGDYRCRHALIRGDCDERGLTVQGDVCIYPRTVLGETFTGVLQQRAEQAGRNPLLVDERDITESMPVAARHPEEQRTGRRGAGLLSHRPIARRPSRPPRPSSAPRAGTRPSGGDPPAVPFRESDRTVSSVLHAHAATAGTASTPTAAAEAPEITSKIADTRTIDAGW